MHCVCFWVVCFCRFCLCTEVADVFCVGAGRSTLCEIKLPLSGDDINFQAVAIRREF